MRSNLLHIRSDPSENRAARTTEESLVAMSLTADVSGDVYRGLARLVRNRHEPPAVVFVCVDDLGPAEMEFFSAVSRSVPGTRVYVYGAERRVADAMARGAAGQVTQDVLDRLRLDAGRSAEQDTAAVVSVGRTHASRAEAPAPRETGTGHAEPEASDEVSGDALGAGPAGDADADAAREASDLPKPASVRDVEDVPRGPIRETFGAPCGGATGSGHPADIEDPTASEDAVTSSRWGEKDAGSVVSGAQGDASTTEGEGGPRTGRVPWLHYEDRPVRKGPPRSAPQDRMRPADAPPPSRGPVKPLLSEDELRALIGDDVAAIEPDDEDSPARRDRADEGDLG